MAPAGPGEAPPVRAGVIACPWDATGSQLQGLVTGAFSGTRIS
jgi:hypothetical protein